MKPLAVLAGLFCCVVAVTSCSAAPPPDHPIYGTWTLTPPDNSCTEIYFFKRDGTSLVTSAEEVAESEYEISPEPTDEGFYRYTDKITKDNGKKDCTGNITLPGEATTSFIAFHRSGDMFVMCQTASLEHCIGPFRRMQGQGS